MLFRKAEAAETIADSSEGTVRLLFRPELNFALDQQNYHLEAKANKSSPLSLFAGQTPSFRPD